jgi:hypothetical protein
MKLEYGFVLTNFWRVGNLFKWMPHQFLKFRSEHKGGACQLAGRGSVERVLMDEHWKRRKIGR